MVEVLPSRAFARDVLKLPAHIQKEIPETIDLFCRNPSHPSLRVKKMKPTARGIWEMSVTMKYRITFHWAKSPEGAKRVAILRRAGPHDILRSP